MTGAADIEMLPWPFTDPIAVGALILLAAMIPTRRKRNDR